MRDNLTRDTIEAIGGKRHHRRAHPNPSSSPSHGSREHGAKYHGEKTGHEHDETFRDEEADRIYNVYLPQEHFMLLESHLRNEMFPALEEERTVNIAGLCRELGHASNEVNDHEGIDEGAGVATVAYEADVPVYCPVVQDSVLDLQAWMHSQTSSFSLGALADMTPLTDLAYDANTAGHLLVGDDVPKDSTLQTMLITPDMYDYGVQVTTDPATINGLSGATLDEARLWDKLEKDTRSTTVPGDTTIMFPLPIVAARERTK